LSFIERTYYGVISSPGNNEHRARTTHFGAVKLQK